VTSDSLRRDRDHPDDRRALNVILIDRLDDHARADVDARRREIDAQTTKRANALERSRQRIMESARRARQYMA